MSYFSDPDAVARYAEGPIRQVPGFVDLQRMASVLLAEASPRELLVLGAGGGLELKAFAEAHTDWRFLGIDPSAEMLALARRTVGPMADRMAWHEGYIHDAPEGPFDAGVCLLTLHFVDAAERLRTLAEVRRRLRPGAPFVVAYHSIDRDTRDLWLSRYGAFAAAAGVPKEKADQAGSAIGKRLPILSPDEDAALLREAGYCDVQLFYAAFTFRGWVAYA